MNNSCKFKIVFIFTFWLVSLNAQTEKPLIEVRSVVDTALITIGDRVNYSIIIERDEGLRIEKPGAGLNLGGFEIKDYDFPEQIEKDGRIIGRFNYNISVYDTGKYTIPPFPVAYFPSDTSQQYKIILAPAIDITVMSVLTGEDVPKLIDVKKPLIIPFDYWFWIWTGLLIILLVGGLFLGYYFYHKRKERGYLFTPPPPPRPAHEIAFEELNILFATDLLEKERYKAFYSELSLIMRTYLENRYFIYALEETTTEIILDIKKKVEDKILRTNLEEILSLSDLVKFAKYKPNNKETAHSKSITMDFIIHTKEETVEEEENTTDPKVENDTDSMQLVEQADDIAQLKDNELEPEKTIN